MKWLPDYAILPGTALIPRKGKERRRTFIILQEVLPLGGCV